MIIFRLLFLIILLAQVGCDSKIRQSISSESELSNNEEIYVRYDELILGEEYNKAYNLIIEKAQKGDPIAQGEIGQFYYYGFNGKSNIDLAKKWLLKSKKQGVVSSIYYLGYIYYITANNEGDLRESFELIEESSILGYSESYNILGVFYSNGIYVDRDLKKAFQNYKKGADLGSRTAQFNLGQAYYWGKGIHKNYHEAFNWYVLSKNNDYPPAYIQLAVMYADGVYVEKDVRKAISLIRPLAEDGYEIAKTNLRVYCNKIPEGC